MRDVYGCSSMLEVKGEIKGLYIYKKQLILDFMDSTRSSMLRKHLNEEDYMKLVSFEVENFRCYSRSFKVKVDSFTAIVGKNDIGKSTLFEALSIFFEQSKMDQNDASVDNEEKTVKITCEFSDLPENLVLDAEYETSLAEEFLLNEEGNLEITKHYDAGLATPKITKITANASHPSDEGYSDLLSLKRPELITRAKALNVDLSQVNKSINAEIRNAIWNSRQGLSLSSSVVDLQKEAGKSVWAELGKYLPAFWLFKSDRASTDQDAEAQNPLNAAIAQAVKAIEEDLEAITNHVRQEVSKVAEATLEKINEMDPDLSASLDPVVKTKKWESLFQTSLTGESGIPLNKRGSGVRRLILLNFFRAQVESAALKNSNASVIYAIEEPETSQHPNNQRMLISTLQQLTSDATRQVLITTHTPMLARVVPDSQIRFVKNEGPFRALAYGGEKYNTEIAKSLGVLPDHNVKVFVCVEGPNDFNFMREISKVLHNEGIDAPDLEQLEINGELIFIPLGGSCLAHWAGRLQALDRPELHIYDRDNTNDLEPKYADEMAKINATDNGIAYCTSKREMENYVHPNAILEAYKNNGIEIKLPEFFGDFDDVPSLVAQQVYERDADRDWNKLSEEKRKKKTSSAKSIINSSAARCMNVVRLHEIGGYEDIMLWLSSIEKHVRA